LSEQDVTPVTRDTAMDASRPMTGAERSRRYREKQKRKPRGYSWPPFEKGNTAAMVHGGNTPQIVDPLSAEIVASLLDSPDCPEHLHQPRYAPALAAWGRAEATVRLIAGWLAGQDVEAALTEITRSAETAEFDKQGNGSRRTIAKRIEASLTALDRHERRAATLRNDLGLTPAAAARMRLDVRPKYDSALIVKALLETDERRGAAGG
jgi:hypothetical protein